MIRRVVWPALVCITGLAFAGSTLLLSAGAAAAAPPEIVAVGWWTRSPTASAPEGGFAIGSAPDGATSVAALRIDVGDGVRSARIEAGEAGGLGQELALVRVCPTSDAWAAAAKGAWEQRAPDGACQSTSVTFERDASARRWRADVTPLVVGRTGEVSLVIAPAPSVGTPGLSAGIGFEAQYSRPALSATPVAAPTPPTTRPAATAETAAPAPVGASAGAGASLPAFEPPPPAAALAAPVNTSPPMSATPEAALPAPTADDGGGTRLTRAPGTDADDGRPWARAALYILISAAVGTAAGIGRRLSRSGLPGPA